MSNVAETGIENYDFDELFSSAKDQIIEAAPAPPTTEIEEADALDDDQVIEATSTEEPEQVVEEDGESDTIKNYIGFLQEQGYLDLPEDYELKATSEGLKTALEDNRKAMYDKTARAFYDSLPDDFKPIMDYALNGGSDINEFVKLTSEQEFEVLNPENPDDQKRLLFLNFKETYPKYDSDRINRMISKFDEDELEQAAKEAYADLLSSKQDRIQQKIAEEQAAKEERERVAQQSAQALRDAIKQATFIDDSLKNSVNALFFNRLNVGGKNMSEFEYFIQNVFKKPEHLAQLGSFFKDYDVNVGFSTKRFEQKGAQKANKNFHQLISTRLDNPSLPKASHKDQHGTIKEDITLEQFLENIK